MEKNMDFNGYNNPFAGAMPPYPNMGGYDNMNYDMPPMGDNSMFNPLMQYEQAYMYYRYLTQQLEYKIKCKEYEKLCSRADNGRNDKKLD